MKDAYYFPHDSNAKDDPKCILLIEQLGLEGYGIFWVLIETLRDQPGYRYPLNLLPALARRFNTTHDKMKVVVHNYSLFTVTDDEFFFSESLINRMMVLDEKREMQRQKALKRWNNDATALPQQCHSNAEVMPVKESKVKKSKVNKNSIFTPPTLEQVKEYCKERNNKVDAEKWFDFYSSKGWMIGKNKMKDWKAAVRTWEKENTLVKTFNKKSNTGNFEQRKHDESYYDNLYDN